MPATRTLFHLALTIAFAFVLIRAAHAMVVCRTPDGATYATDEPPPDCAPIPSSDIERFPPYSGREEGAESARPRSAQEAPARAVEEAPPPIQEALPPTQEEPFRRTADDDPESGRTHAMASCEQSVAEQLERPSSARWPNRGDYRVKEHGGRYSVEGQVEAEQALGSSKIDWTCDAVFTGDRWVAVAELRKQDAPPPIAAAPPAFPPSRSAERAEANVRETLAMPPPAAPIDRPLPAEASPPPDMLASTAPVGAPVAEQWKERASCPGIKFDASTEKHKTEGYQIVSGQIIYTGMRPVRDVRVCASGICQLVRNANAPMTQGTSEKFSVKAPSLETPTITAQCSVMIDGPGM